MPRRASTRRKESAGFAVRLKQGRPAGGRRIDEAEIGSIPRRPVGDITLSAYFIDATSRKNENLCEATKRSLDRDAAALAKEQKGKSTNYRQCLTLSDAIHAGYVESSK
jgi:hypothetical protein